MGGFAPIGYVPHERTLAVDEPRAQRVREIFQLYLELGCVRRLKLELDARGWKTPERQGKRPGGGRAFTRGHLYRLLSNPVYVGGISHKGVVHPGQHQAILAQEVWDATQAKLAQNAQGHSDRIHAAEPSLLAGLLIDEHGRRLNPSHAKKGGKRYRYYCTAAGTQSDDAKAAMRIPALELERAVLNEVIGFLRDEQGLLAAVPSLNAVDTRALFESAAKRAAVLSTGHAADRIRTINALVARVVVGLSALEIDLRVAGLRTTQSTDASRVHSIAVPVQLRHGNHAMRLVVRDQSYRAQGRQMLGWWHC